MSRKNYVEIAQAIDDVIKTYGSFKGDSDADHAMASLVSKLSDIFKADNARFNWQQFYKACGLDPNLKYTVTKWGQII